MDTFDAALWIAGLAVAVLVGLSWVVWRMMRDPADPPAQAETVRRDG